MDPVAAAAAEELRRRVGEITDLDSTAALLDWDQSTQMPGRGGDARSRQLATIGRIAHDRRADPRLGEVIAILSEVDDLTSNDKALLRLAHREHRRAVDVPSDLVGEIKQHLGKSFHVWAEARKNNDFRAVVPTLERTVELSRAWAEAQSGFATVRDALIDELDPGLTEGDVQRLFAELRPAIVELVQLLGERPAPADEFLCNGPFDIDRQITFGEEVVAALGYDFERGRRDETHHPFCTRIAYGDVRITTNHVGDDIRPGLFGAIHEAGHAMYEQNIAPELDGTLAANGASAGVHESQSRLWENLVARSESFWMFWKSRLDLAFPHLSDVPIDDFVRAINRVQPTLIRIEADEVTYNLHVMIRFELESKLLSGDLKAADLAEAWRDTYRRDLGVSSADDRDGVLQDIHWYAMLIGGAFQGYTLGNVMSAQFFAAAERELTDLDGALRKGDYSPLRGWLTDKLYRHGSTKEPLDLLESATGAPLTAEPYLAYLRRKFGALYAL